MMRLVGLATLGALLLSALPADAQEEEGLPVSVTVIDEVGAPVPTAWVRIPDTEGRRNVDAKTGTWTARSLYTFDAEEIFFQKGMVIEFTVSAPGYSSFTGRYEVRRRRNEMIVKLEPLEMVPGEMDESSIQWFKRTEAPPTTGRYVMDPEHGTRLAKPDEVTDDGDDEEEPEPADETPPPEGDDEN